MTIKDPTTESTAEEDDDTHRVACQKIKHNQFNKREVPTLVGAGSSTSSDDDTVYDPKLVLYYNFDNQHSFLQISVQDSSAFENHGRFSPGGLVLQIPGSTCNDAAYLAASDIVINGETFQAKPTYGITIAAYIMLLDIKGRHNVFESYGYNNPHGQYHFEVDYGILRWFHSNRAQGTVFEVAAELVPLKVWTHVVGTFNSTTGIAQIYIDGKAVNRTYGKGKMSKDWSCLAHIGGQCKNKALLGFIDEFRIYNYALSSKEVKDIFSLCTFIGIRGLSAPAPLPDYSTPAEPQDEYFVKKDKVPGLKFKVQTKYEKNPENTEIEQV